MFFLKHVLPLVLLSAVIGFVIARLNLLPPESWRSASAPPAVQPQSLPVEATPQPEAEIQEPELPYAEAVAPAAEEASADWSADHFMDVLEEEESSTGEDVNVQQVLEEVVAGEAAGRSTAGSVEDPYLASVLREAEQLSLAATPEVNEPVSAPEPEPAPEPVTEAPPEPVVEPEIFIVEDGDTLSSIAEEVYGDRMDFMRIYEANRDQLKTPDDLEPGQRLRIPR